MPRTPRVEVAGGIHHVTARGNRQQAIFGDDRDRASLLHDLAMVAKSHAWIPLAYCLMSNHVHLVVETRQETLGVGMRQLAGNQAQRFNRRYEKSGHLFQGRYHSVLVRSEQHFAQLLRYVALNPVTAGLCRDPIHWRWSNHRALLAGGGQVPVRVESLLESWGGTPGHRYRRLFEPGHPLETRFGAEDPSQHRPPLGVLLTGEDLDAAMRRARDHGYRLAEIAAEVGLHVSQVSRRTRGAN